ncbi:MAG: MauE/DoxX family redox-associated membrane protein [Bryobacteraceae bacterium]
MQRLLFALRLILGAVLIYAAYTKLRQPWLLFAISIDSYRMLPEWAVLSLARTLPWLELALGILLVSGWLLRYVTLVATALLGGFFVVMLIAYQKGLGADCGCFGVGEALSGLTLLRDGTLLTVSILLVVFSRRRPDRSSFSQATLSQPKSGDAAAV